MISTVKRMLWTRLFGLLEPRVNRLEVQLDALRSKLEISDQLVADFAEARISSAYQVAFTDPEPLVSVCIATYNRAELLLDRSLPSVISQSYANLEIVVVGDGCTDETESRMSQLNDPRIRFVNLSEHSKKPDRGSHRWMSLGATPGNHALRLARGAFITHLDDDDEYLPQRIETLVSFAQANRSDVVFHPWETQRPNGAWRQMPARDFRFGGVGTCMVLYHEWLKKITWDPNSFRFEEPMDWNRFRKFAYLGAKTDRCPKSLVRIYRAPKS